MPIIDLPSNLSYGTVTGRFLLAYADSADGDVYPDGQAAKGSIFFTPSPAYLLDATATPDPVTVVPATVEAVLDSDGYLCGYGTTRGIRLLATDDPQANPVNWTWEVSFRLTDQTDTPVNIEPYSFSLPSGTTVDLTALSPVPGADGTFYTVGPTGPQGPQGIQGEPGDLSNLNATAPIVYNSTTSTLTFDPTYVTFINGGTA